jgi:hypothetical protein
LAPTHWAAPFAPRHARRHGRCLLLGGHLHGKVAAGVTVIAVWLPVIVPMLVSVAVIDCSPAVLSVALKVWTPASGAGEGVVGGQDRLGVGAREVDRPV